ncbi:hypothetical protein BOH66_12875 [Microbacterium aurum]|uniref:Acyltransferase n=1 Tax=Microbacterium aurum TaxID=36805 RepID=A0A1P8UAD3_9MICO|nr:acyltransferase family protein [Microbacterium aurum]APZ35036.1 hypothetical protein BOH66_12875 [Microbacterium aurum]
MSEEPLNHLWPTRLPGGYVGVDVFFVISGYLITAHLLKEVVMTGGIRLGAFYARRIRRLLPAALLVLAASATLVFVYLPYTRWERNGTEIAASAGYVENWWLAHLSVNYSALNDSASVAQHYWSLSVEEQFYLVWPLLIVAALTIFSSRIGGTAARRGTVVGLLAVVFASSLAASIVFTQFEPSQAYFVTFTRGWEFAVGGILAAMGGARLRMPQPVANIMAVAGIVGILFSLLAFGPETPFPGVAALVPVLGTAAIIAAGTREGGLAHSWVTGNAFTQWLGGVSYSLYLWHWPIIVIAPFVLGTELTGLSRIGLLAIALVLAWLTKALVEDPARNWVFWRSSTLRSIVLMVVGVLAVLACAGGLLIGSALRSTADRPDAPLATGSCDGPHALSNAADCPSVFDLADSPYMGKRNEYFFYPPQCGPTQPDPHGGDVVPIIVCDFSNESGPKSNVWVVGDSHAQQWQGAVFELARREGWIVTLAYRGHCPPADVAYIGFRTVLSAGEVSGCREWSRAVTGAVEEARPEMVFTGMAARQYLVDDGSGRSAAEQMIDGMTSDWAAWSSVGSRVIAMADPPFNGEVRDPDCVILNTQDPVACARPRSEAQPADPVVSAVSRMGDERVSLVDLTDHFCDVDTCYAVVGGVPVYYDADHLNLVYVRMLADDIAGAVGIR